MAYNGSGTYSLPAGNPVVTGTVVSSTVQNNTMSDVATALSTALCKDGQQTPTANLPMGGFKLTGLGAGNAAGNSLRYEQLFTTSAVAMLGAMDWFKGADIASAATVNLTTATGNAVHITGTVTITAVTLGSGMWRLVIFDGILTLTHHATNNNLPGATNITTAAGDRALYWSDGTTVYCAQYTKAAGGLPSAFSMSPITASLGADVNLNNTGLYFDGPSVAQGTAGTWFVSGQVACLDTSSGANFTAKLWDGTTVIAEATFQTQGASQNGTISISGYMASPAGNLRISVKDGTSVNGRITSSLGATKAATITAIRIA